MRSKWMRYTSSSASRSPCWARSTSRRTLSVDSRAGFFSGASELTGFRSTPLARSKPDAARPAEALEIRHARHDHVVRAVLTVEYDDAGPILMQRTLELLRR